MEIQTRNLDMYFERRVYIYPAVNLSPSPLHLPLITRTSAHGAVKPIDQAGPTRPAAVTRENTYENTGETSSSVRRSRYKSQPRDAGGACVSLENLQHEGNNYPPPEIASTSLMMMMMMVIMVMVMVSIISLAIA